MLRALSYLLAFTSLILTGCGDKAGVSFEVAAITIPEDGGTQEFRVVLNRPSEEEPTEPGTEQADQPPVTVHYTVEGTSREGVDHTFSAGTWVIPENQTSVVDTVTILEDDLDEWNETIIIRITSVEGTNIGGQPTLTITIADNDGPPDMSMTHTNISALSESFGTYTITYTIDMVSGRDIVIPYTVGGTSSSPSDHGLASGTVTLPEGDLSVSRSFGFVIDSDTEGIETILYTTDPVQTDGETTANLTGTTAFNIDLYDAPSVEFTTTAQTINENVGSVTYTLSIDIIAGLDVTIPISIAGTSTSADHDITGPTLTIPAGQLTVSDTINITEDVLDENDETIILSLGTITNGVGGTNSTQTITITDNDPLPDANWTASGQTIAEGASGTLTAQLAVVSGRDVTIGYTVGGTSVNPADHNLSAGVIFIPEGQLTGTASISVVQETVYEASETATATLATTTTANLINPSTHTITIPNDDPIPTVNFTTASQAVSEAVGTVSVTASISNLSGFDITVPYTVAGTATNPADHDLANGNITISAGDSSGSVSFNMVSDTLQENAETIVVFMGTPSGANAGGTTSQVINITDDDPTPTVNFATSQTLAETAGTATVSVSLSNPTVRTITVPYTVSGTASNPADHNFAAGSITVAATTTGGSTNFSIVSDALDETNETVIATMGVPTNATAGGTTTHTVTITDDDPTPTTNFSTATQTVAEGVGTVTVTATLDAASGQTVSVPYTVTGTANNPNDHDLAAGTITITAGNASGSTNFSVTNDALNEANETVIVTMGTPTNANAGATNVQTITITDDDAQPTLNLTTNTQTVGEAVGVVTVTASISAASGRDITTAYSVGGTATNPADHNLAAGNIVITEGNTTGSTSFSLVSDSLEEGAETVTVSLAAPDFAALGATNVQTINITDDDPTPTVNFAAGFSQGEAGGLTTVTVNLSNPTVNAVSVPYTVGGSATNPDDHDLAAGTINVVAESTTGTTTFTIVSDALDEDNETVIANMGVPTNANAGGTTSQTITITDDDPTPTVSYTTNSQTVGESVGAVTITASLSAVSGRNITVPHTVSGTATNPADHDLAAGSIVINAGNGSNFTTFNVANDGDMEGSETVIVTMGVPTNATQGGTTVQTITINDDDVLVLAAAVAQSRTITENAGRIRIPLSLDRPSPTPVQATVVVSGDAILGEDYLLPAPTVVFAAGETKTELAIEILDDSRWEPEEELLVGLLGRGPPYSQRIRIADNDRFAKYPVKLWLKSNAGIQTDSNGSVQDWHTLRPSVVFRQEIESARPGLTRNTQVRFERGHELVTELDPEGNEMWDAFASYRQSTETCGNAPSFFTFDGLFRLGFGNDFWAGDIAELLLVECVGNCTPTREAIQQYFDEQDNTALCFDHWSFSPLREWN